MQVMQVMQVMQAVQAVQAMQAALAPQQPSTSARLTIRSKSYVSPYIRYRQRRLTILHRVQWESPSRSGVSQPGIVRPHQLSRSKNISRELCERSHLKTCTPI